MWAMTVLLALSEMEDGVLSVFGLRAKRFEEGLRRGSPGTWFGGIDY